jgi:hypothetical protein
MEVAIQILSGIFYPQLQRNLDITIILKTEIKKVNRLIKIPEVRGYHIFESISTNSNNGYYESTTGASILWGFQKTFKGNFNINLNTGINYDFRSEKVQAPILNFSLGWVIGK